MTGYVYKESFFPIETRHSIKKMQLSNDEFWSIVKSFQELVSNCITDDDSSSEITLEKLYEE